VRIPLLVAQRIEHCGRKMSIFAFERGRPQDLQLGCLEPLDIFPVTQDTSSSIVLTDTSNVSGSFIPRVGLFWVWHKRSALYLEQAIDSVSDKQLCDIA
jgi:hypothetical protein